MNVLERYWLVTFVDSFYHLLQLLALLHQDRVIRLCLLQVRLNLLFGQLFGVFGVDFLCSKAFSDCEIDVKLRVFGKATFFALVGVSFVVVNVSTLRTLECTFSTVITIALWVCYFATTSRARDGFFFLKRWWWLIRVDTLNCIIWKLSSMIIWQFGKQAIQLKTYS